MSTPSPPERARFLTTWDDGRLVLVLDAVLLTASFLLASLLRFEFQIPVHIRQSLWLFTAVAVPIRLVVLAWAGSYRAIPRYSGLNDMMRLVFAMAASTGIVAVAGHVMAQPLALSRIPLAVLLIDFFVGTAFLGGGRVAYRMLFQHRRPRPDRRRTLIVGAGGGGSLVASHLRQHHQHDRKVIGFADDAPAKRGKVLNGVPILGPIADLPRLIDEHAVDEVLFGIPSATGDLVRETLYLCGGKVSFRTMPGLLELGAGRDTPTHVREVQVEDLLRRKTVRLEGEEVQRLIGGRACLVTGGGGSIGSELCRQIASQRPSKLIVYERYENNLYEIHHELSRNFPELRIRPVVGDHNDHRLLSHVLKNEQPQVLFHAAAHKHVPLMEENAVEAIRNNIFGTRGLAEHAERFGVDEFVLISTDKAVRPTSVMGATKRIAEKIVQSRSGLSSTRFVTVRFGNVLNSAGSVVPLFTRQIRAGGPVTVTHPEVRRYFMTILEAAQLVIQAGAIGRGGEVFVLDMGEPVRIMDLARDLITLSGHRPGVDIEIQTVGLRPGEKLFEELLDDDGEPERTRHPKIMVVPAPPVDASWLDGQLAELAGAVEQHDNTLALQQLWHLVEQLSPRHPAEAG